MYKVLVADDEKMILQGIATLVDWDKLGTRLTGMALNGQQACEMVQREAPDIIITDIKMPIMNGIELIKTVKASHPTIRFIILSGHEEFQFAKQAMEYEVKHYLLKPCNHHKISDVLANLVDELNAENEKERYIRNTVSHLEKALPKIKEQLLKELLTNKAYGAKEWNYYKELLRQKDDRTGVKLILLEPDTASEYMYLFALNNIASEMMEPVGSVLLSTTLDGRVAILMEDRPSPLIIGALQQIQEVYHYYYNLTFTAAVSDAGEVASVRQLYQQTMGCVKHRFYYGAGSILTRQELHSGQQCADEPQFDHEHLIYALRSGNIEEAEQYINHFFDRLKLMLHDIEVVKTYSLELYMVIIRQSDSAELDRYFKRAATLQSMETLEAVRAFVAEDAGKIASAFYESQISSQSQIVRKMVQYVNDHIAEESLSLLNLANDIMYMNADYLGRLFKKETGMRFTAYLVQTRIETAKKLLADKEEATMVQIAGQVGFGNNPKYFSQLFKRETGHTPSDYKRLNG